MKTQKVCFIIRIESENGKRVFGLIKKKIRFGEMYESN